MARQGPVADEEEESSALLCEYCCCGCFSQAGGKVFVRGRRGLAVERTEGGGSGGLRGLVQGCDGEKREWPEGGVGRYA